MLRRRSVSLLGTRSSARFCGGAGYSDDQIDAVGPRVTERIKQLAKAEYDAGELSTTISVPAQPVEARPPAPPVKPETVEPEAVVDVGEADVKVQGYEDTSLPDNYFDLAISNVPFGNCTVHDPAYPSLRPIHNYFFEKSLDKVRSGGVVAFITSHFTLDSKGAEFRKMLARKADLLGSLCRTFA